MIYIDLKGSGGNAFSLMGTAKKVGKELGFEKPKIDGIIQEMMSGDYENLKKVFIKNFGEYFAFEEDCDD
jgi:hypothetical protein